MDVREKMIEYRTKNDIDIEKMSKKTKVSVRLLSMVENGDVTHPGIVERIRKAYKLTKKESYDLMPENHRPNSPEYDPDKYKVPETDGKNFAIRKTDQYDEYLAYMKNKKWREEYRGYDRPHY